MIQLERRLCVIFALCLVPCETSRANKNVLEWNL